MLRDTFKKDALSFPSKANFVSVPHRKGSQKRGRTRRTRTHTHIHARTHTHTCTRRRAHAQTYIHTLFHTPFMCVQNICKAFTKLFQREGIHDDLRQSLLCPERGHAQVLEE